MDTAKTTIIKYLASLVKRFENIKKGVTKNEYLWKNFNITTESIEEHIKKINHTGEEIERLKKELSMKLSTARELKESEKKILEQLEKRAIGIHADDENKLIEYDIGNQNINAKQTTNTQNKNNFKAA